MWQVVYAWPHHVIPRHWSTVHYQEFSRGLEAKEWKPTWRLMGPWDISSNNFLLLFSNFHEVFDTYALCSDSLKADFHPIFSSLPGNNGPTYKDFPLCGESKLVLCVFSDSPFVVSLHRFTRLCGNSSIWGAVFKAKSRESHSGIHFSTLTVYSGVEVKTMVDFE